jgi:hypothetical protein
MPNPFKIYDKNKGPAWLKQLDKYVEVPERNPYRKLDNAALEKNHGGDRKLIDEATYVEGKGK